MLPGLFPVEIWPLGSAQGPGLQQIIAGGAHVFILALPVDPEPWIAMLYPLASEERRTRALRFRFKVDALRCLAAEALLRHAMFELFEIPSRMVLSEITPEGKPYLSGQPSIHYSISHSGTWILCGVHSEPLGIDVEEVRSTIILPVETVMAPEEIRRYTSLPSPAALIFFFRLWTLKESLLKAIGTGLYLDPRKITLHFDDPSISATYGLNPALHWQFHKLKMPEDTVASICSRAR